MRFDGVERLSYFTNKREYSNNKQSNKIIFFLFIFGIIIALFLFSYIFVFQEMIFAKDRSVQIRIDLPEEVVIGKETSFSISVFNQERSALLDAELFINFPTGFKLISVEPLCSKVSSAGCFVNFPKIENKGVKDIKIVGKFFNLIEEQAEIKTRLSFQLENFSSWFKKESSRQIFFINPNINLDLDGPPALMMGEEGSFVIRSFNNEDEPLTLSIVLISPDFFNFTNFSPVYYDKKNEKVIWRFDFDRYEEKIIDFSGYFKEGLNQNEIIVQMGVFDEDDNFFPQLEKKFLVEINKPGLALGLRVNNFFDEIIAGNFGENISLVLSYKNIGQEKIFEPVFEFKINPFYAVILEKNENWHTEEKDGNLIVLISQGKEINPGEEDEIKIDLRIKNKEEIANNLVSSIIFTAEAEAKIFHQQVIIFKTISNQIAIKLPQ